MGIGERHTGTDATFLRTQANLANGTTFVWETAENNRLGAKFGTPPLLGRYPEPGNDAKMDQHEHLRQIALGAVLIPLEHMFYLMSICGIYVETKY
jgi:hypothetical protein